SAAVAANASMAASGAAENAATASASAATSSAGAASAAANAANTSAANEPSATPGASAAAAPETTAAADFVNKAAATDMYEIAAARLALKDSTNPGVRAFARLMIHDHTQSTANLKAAIAASGQALTLPQGLSPDLRANMDALRAAPKGAFDRTYVAQMVETHEQAKQVLAAYAANGDVAPLKTFAAKTLTVVRTHLAKAQTLVPKV
ncbi:MAG: DUF4142 domain-containing protein, partial [Caulobacteraceae bacterium]